MSQPNYVKLWWPFRKVHKSHSYPHERQEDWLTPQWDDIHFLHRVLALQCNSLQGLYSVALLFYPFFLTFSVLNFFFFGFPYPSCGSLSAIWPKYNTDLALREFLNCWATSFLFQAAVDVYGQSTLGSISFLFIFYFMFTEFNCYSFFLCFYLFQGSFSLCSWSSLCRPQRTRTHWDMAASALLSTEHLKLCFTMSSWW